MLFQLRQIALRTSLHHRSVNSPVELFQLTLDLVRNLLGLREEEGYLLKTKMNETVTKENCKNSPSVQLLTIWARRQRLTDVGALYWATLLVHWVTCVYYWGSASLGAIS